MKAKDLSKEIAKELALFENATLADIEEAAKEVADEACQIVKEQASKHYPKSYVNSIKVVKQSKRGKTLIYVSAGDHYRVAHLLEHGHALVKGGRKLKQVEGHPHFEQGENYVDRQYAERVARKVKNGY